MCRSTDTKRARLSLLQIAHSRRVPRAVRLSSPAAAPTRWHRSTGLGVSRSTTDWCSRRPRRHQWPLMIEVPFAPESERSGIGELAFILACWYEREFDFPSDDVGRRTARARDPAFRRGGLSRTRLGERHAGGRARRRPHTVLGGHHTCLASGHRAACHGQGRGRSPRSGEAARQTGLATRAAQHLVSAYDGYLADGVDGVVASSTSVHPVDAERRALGDRAACLVAGDNARICGSRVRLRPASRCSPMNVSRRQPRSPSPHRIIRSRHR